MEASPTIHIVDDDALVRECLADMAMDAGYAALTHATAEDFLADAEVASAGCVVVDLNLPGIDGLDLMDRIAGRDPDLPVIMVSGAGKVAQVVAALKGGAVDFIQKPVRAAAFAQSLAEAAKRRRQRADARDSLARLRERAQRLSHRERQVMALITDGLSNNAVAAALGISVRTVENHRARVMDKMGAANLTDLIRQTLRLGEGEATGAARAPQ
ncbi:response regulator transcription factor [Caulobacter sp. KR2-114]|uniref:response regulator transcription factor n=1 Tax=Caulobacter sp. KR2-114 TaxID=3400912 RepID=UPI003C05EC69